MAGAAPMSLAPLSLTIANESGRGPLWTYVVGTDLASGQQCRLSADGALVPVVRGRQRPGRLHRLRDRGRTARGRCRCHRACPAGSTSRSASKLKFRCNPGNALAYPAGWVTADPNYPVLHDCAEFTYDGAGHALQHHDGRHAVGAAGDLAVAARRSRPTGRLQGRRPRGRVLRAGGHAGVREPRDGGPAGDRAGPRAGRGPVRRRTTSRAGSTRCGTTTARTR